MILGGGVPLVGPQEARTKWIFSQGVYFEPRAGVEVTEDSRVS